MRIVNYLKTLSFTTAALLAASAPADAYFRAAMEVYKEYRQGSTTGGIPAFRYGRAYMYVVDGVVTVTAGCAFNGVAEFFPPAPLAGCNTGATGVILDGILDNAAYPEYDERFYEIVGIEAATLVEPGLPELVKLTARPANGTFPATVGPIRAVPTFVYFDLRSLTGDVREYRLAGTGLARFKFRPGYSFMREYDSTSKSRMEKEIVEGVYQFSFPTRGRQTTPMYLNFPIKNSVESYVSKPVKQGFRFLGVAPYVDGFALYDSRVSNTFYWEGLTTTTVSSGDRLYVGFRRMVDLDDPDSALLYTDYSGDGERDFDLDDPIYDFPPPDLPNDFPGARILMSTPRTTSYTLPSGFFRPTPANPNPSTMLEITLERDPLSGLGIVNRRLFQLPIRFVNTFTGAMVSSFPEGTSAAMMDKDADPDGDGISNWVEWLSNTDPSKPNAPKTLSALSFVPPSAAKAGEPVSGYYEMSLDKAEGTIVGADVDVESSTDLKTWTLLTASDPQWSRVDEVSRIRVISKTPTLTEKRYFRIKYTYRP